MKLIPRSGKRRRVRRRKDHATPRHSFRHPRFGEIPLIEIERAAFDGRTYKSFEFDPEYKPPLPAGAVRGDIRRQLYCHLTPHYFYVDEKRTCVQCALTFVFSANEQRFWYETLQFHLASTAIRCTVCRKKRRSDAALGRAVAESLRLTETRPESPSALLALAEATVNYFDRFAEGNLGRAIASCRKARKIAALLPESLYWEARCHQAAGRRAKARPLLESFVAKAGTIRRYRRLAQAASRAIASLS